MQIVCLDSLPNQSLEIEGDRGVWRKLGGSRTATVEEVAMGKALKALQAIADQSPEEPKDGAEFGDGDGAELTPKPVSKRATKQGNQGGDPK